MPERQGIKIVPLIVGALTEAVGSVATGMMLVVSLAASGIPDYEILIRMHSMSGLLLTMIAHLGFAGLGGYFAGEMAGRYPILHGGIVGAVGLLMAGLCREGNLPLWYDLLSLGGMIPAGMAGGAMARPEVSPRHGDGTKR